MTVVKLVLEGERPISWNQLYSSNLHWSQRKTEAFRAHMLVDVECRELGDLPVLVYPVYLIFIAYLKSNPMDWDNITTKLYTDGLVHAGLLKDDKPSLVPGGCTFSLLDRKNPRLEIFIYDSRSCDAYADHVGRLVKKATGIATG